MLLRSQQNLIIFSLIFKQTVVDLYDLFKKKTVEQKCLKNTCRISATPYNAHPLTGNKPTQSAMDTEPAARDSEKNKQKKLDSQ